MKIYLVLFPKDSGSKEFQIGYISNIFKTIFPIVLSRNVFACRLERKTEGNLTCSNFIIGFSAETHDMSETLKDKCRHALTYFTET